MENVRFWFNFLLKKGKTGTVKQQNIETLMCFLKVTVLQVIGSSANAENISFLLDSSLSNVTVYITGVSPHFTLYSPTGE